MIQTRFTINSNYETEEIYATYTDGNTILDISIYNGQIWLLNTSTKNGSKLSGKKYDTFEDLCDELGIIQNASLWKVVDTDELLSKYLIETVELTVEAETKQPELKIKQIKDKSATNEVELYTNDLGGGKHRTTVPPLNISENSTNKIADNFYKVFSKIFEEANKKIKTKESKFKRFKTRAKSEKYSVEDFNKIVQGTDANYLSKLCHIKGALLLKSHPGTGKTTTAIELAKYMTGETESDRVLFLSFNQNTSYSDIIGGIKKLDADTDWENCKGTLSEFFDKAEENPGNDYVVIIDEINRANTESVLGELLTAIEKRDVPVMTNNGWEILVPKRVYFVATMNSADASTVELDSALKDRFMVYRMPMISMNCSLIKPDASEELLLGMQYVADGIVAINKYLIQDKYKREDNQIGNRALYTNYNSLEELILVVNHDIRPKVEDKLVFMEENERKDIIAEIDKIISNIKSLL